MGPSPIRSAAVLPRPAAWITLVYVLAGVLWILGSDELAAVFFSGRALQVVSTLKGGVYVVATGVLLFVVLRAWERRYQVTLDEQAAAAARDREFFRANPHPMWVYEVATLRLLDANDAASVLLGRRRDELLRCTLFDLVAPEEHDRLRAASGEVPTVEDRGIWAHRRPDGTRLEVAIAVRATRFDGVDAGLVAGNDLTAAREMERRVEAAERTYRQVLDGLTDVVWLIDPATGALRYLSPHVRDVLGVGTQVFAENPEAWALFVVPEDHAIVEAKNTKMRRGEPSVSEYRVRLPDGRERWVLDRVSVVRDAGGVPTAIVGIAGDITEHRLTEEEMRLAARVFDQARESILVTDASERIVRVNAATRAMTGFTPEELRGKTPRVLSSGRQDRAFYQRMWASLAEHRRWEGEIWNKKKSGEVYAAWLAITVLTDSRGIATNYVAVFTDLTERKRAEADIHRLAWYDAVTALPNKSLATVSIESQLLVARGSGEELALFCIDLDRFKLVNDSLGHAAGDRLLREAGRRLELTAGGRDLVFRGSGAQFFVVVRAVPAALDVVGRAGRLLGCLREPFHLDERELRLTASLGVATWPRDAADPAGLIQNAEAALYDAKQRGRDRYGIFTPALNAALLDRLTLENRLRVAIQHGELEVWYQPQVDIATGRLGGVEALVRWRSPTQGLISPARFIPVAEESELIVPIGRQVLARACRDAVAWGAFGLGPLRVAVNVSGVEFARAGFVAGVEQELRASGLPAELLELELTESVVVGKTDEVLATLKALTALGLHLAIDDFGTGYSSLSYLRRFPIDRLKIDRSFITHVLQDAGAQAITRAIIGITKGLGLSVIAEGVETVEQAQFLEQHGCPDAQGFLYATPMPFPELVEWARRRNAA